jgi:predicted O-methyltransferase YrrM
MKAEAVVNAGKIVGIGARAASGIARYEPAAAAMHGIGRGEYPGLVFSGPEAVLGEIAGYPTWQTGKKWVLPDPRVGREADFAACVHGMMPLWERGLKPMPGICFVFSDERHPGVSEMRARGAEEFEDYVVLSALTVDRLLQRKIERWVENVKTRPIAVLGFGDQGRRIAAAIVSAGVDAGDVVVADGDAERMRAAQDAGFGAMDVRDPAIERMAVVSTPLRRPEAFDAVLDRARANGCAVFDNSTPDGAGGGEFVLRENVRLTRGADRVCKVSGASVRLREGAMATTLRVVRQEARTFGRWSVEHLQTGQRAELRAGCAIALDEPWSGDRLPGLSRRLMKAWVGIDGTSNQHDAALGLFACREMLMGVREGAWARSVRELVPTSERVGLGATRFESLIASSITGRTLGAPYLSAPEQLVLGVVARECASDSGIVEVGSALGGSTLLMTVATEQKDGMGPPVYSVDPDLETRPAMRVSFEHAKLMHRLTMIEKTSDEAVRDLAAVREQGAGLVFIDGLHTREQCRRDVENYAPMVKRGGVLLMHDTDVRFSGVARCAMDLAMHDERFELVCIVDTISVFLRR